MNTFWTLPTAIEAAIFVLCLLIARIALRLRLRSAAVALVLICPVPLAYLVAGSDSAIYASDVVGVLCLFWLASSRNRFRAGFTDTVAHLPVVFASLLLVVLPTLSTALGLIATRQGDWKLIVAGLCRGFGYLGLFCAAIGIGRLSDDLEKMLTLQCIAFSLVCCCGIWQTITGLDLTLPDPNTLLAGLTPDSSAGFMGLYRGAIGAWGAAMLGVIPLVLFRRGYGWVIAPACMLAVLTAIVLVGSRQGLVIGLMSAVFGTLGALTTARHSASSAVRSLFAVVTLALGGLYLLSIAANTSFDTWMTQRFGSIVGAESVVDQVASRDNKMWYAVDRWFSAPVTVQALGAGRGRLNQGLAEDEREVGYVDSELVWQLQENGLVGIMIYISFLVLLARCFRRPKRTSEAIRTTILAGRVGLFTGVCLIYGHFFLLHVHTAQASVAYWNWALFGVALGAGIRAKRESRRSPLTISRPNSFGIARLNTLATK